MNENETTVEHVETLIASGASIDVTYARVAAWEALKQSVGTDPVEAWDCRKISYGLAQMEGGEKAIQWSAEFVRQS